MTPKPPATKRADGTLNALCKTLGLGKRRVSELLKQGMPDDPKAALEWRTARENDDTSTELRRCRINLLREQERLARIKADEADGLVVSRAECQQAWTLLGSALGKAMQMAAREIPQVCLGLPISQSLPKAKEKMNEIQTMFADAESDFWKSKPGKGDT